MAENRQLWVITGKQSTAIARAKKLLANFPKAWVLDQPSTLKGVLGKEYRAVIYNMYHGFDPDLLGAVGGTIVAGGVLVLVTPSFEDWPLYPDPFKNRIANWPFQGSDLSSNSIERFIRKLESHAFIKRLSENEKIDVLAVPASQYLPIHFQTQDQKRAIKSLCKIVRSRDPVPVVLEADRGRGKSAVLGKLVGELACEHLTIIATAPSRVTADIIFHHAPEYAHLSFISPDRLCKELPPADLLLVDEAAAIPSSLLTRMLKQYARIIFSTTVHGYEGTGRGFALRFKDQLDTLTPRWLKIKLNQPIRYGENDPLERFLFDSLLFDAKPVDQKNLKDFKLTECKFRVLKPDRLARDDILLRNVFGLLVLAHYQTRPTDLRHMLDGKNISVAVMTWHGHVVATALSVVEGGIDTELAHEIHYGVRRPRGHLVPQSLAVHAGIADAPEYLTQRIMRIVVHPTLQRQGVGGLLLKTLEKKANADYLSCSFGAAPGLITFWKKLGFSPVRLGLSRDASSGYHSVIMMKPLNTRGERLFKKAVTQFHRYLPVLLSEPLKDLETEIIQVLDIAETGTDKNNEQLEINSQDREDILSFAYGFRGYENCMLALKKLVSRSIREKTVWEQLSAKEKILLEGKIIQQKNWQDLSEIMQLAGRKKLVKDMRQLIRHIIEIS